MLAHRCLNAYADGRLPEALTMSEEAVAFARLRGHPRAEATALVNLAFMRMWIGDFSLAYSALNEAEDAFGEVTDPFDRYESPLCFGARGAVRSLRGDVRNAEEDFTRAIDTARRLDAQWYEAIARALRAEFTASIDPRRARADARWAMNELRRRDDQWWWAWAAQAAGVAALEAGMPDAAETVLREVLDHPQPKLERARTLLLLGETKARAGRGADATSILREAAGTFEAAGAIYWQARCHVRLAGADPANAQTWIGRVRRLREKDPAYRHLFTVGAMHLIAFGPGQILCAGHPIKARTHNTERALFLLALAGSNGLHVEELADRLWTCASVDHRRLLGRVRTLLWEGRQILGTQSWRLLRDGPIVKFDTAGITFDLLEAQGAARTALRAQECGRARWPSSCASHC